MCPANKSEIVIVVEHLNASPEQPDICTCWDPDKLVQCPFDKNHQIRVCRFPYHLLKCRKNHPELARELKTCPYNARHLIHKHELARHIETCENRMSVYTEEAGSTNRSLHVPVSTWVNPTVTEDWDKGKTDNQKFIQETRPTNNLGPSFRAPNTLPWSNKTT
uniref:CHHC U11-48K-type domain-containing protein n=1 Tax=Acanthochromis polyacanthus TaxID=80966 RepID=A0A3Q1G8P8_9TELE